MRRIAFMNQKGGVGKTTTVANLAAALAERGRRVLVVDMDPQANLSAHLDFDLEDGRPSVYEVLTGRTGAGDAVVETETENMLLLPSSIDLSGAEIELVQEMGRETLLRQALEDYFRDLPPGDGFEFLLIDCPPSLGLLSLNALTTATEVMIPIQTQYFALRGMSKLLEVIALVRARLRPQLTISLIIPSIADLRTRLTAEVLREIREHFGDRMARTLIRTNVRLAEAPSHGRTILQYDSSSRGAEDYRRLAREILGELTREDHEVIQEIRRKLDREPVSFDELPPTPAESEG
jgi:chromosome partitioning protein